MSIQQPPDNGAPDSNPALPEDTVTASNGPSSKKQPPPEKPSDIRRRSHVILSFWLIVLCLGLPIWWRTTSIYRADLPLQEMLDWSDGKACRPVFPLHISVQANALQEQEAQNLLRLTQHALDDLNDFSGHHLRLQLSPPSTTETYDRDSVLTIRLTPGESTTSTLDPHEPIIDITYPPNAIPAPSSSSSSLATYVANVLRSTFAEEQATISYLLSTNSIPSEHRPQGLAPDVAESLSKRTTRSLKYAPTYHLTFSLFTGGPLPSSWDIEGAIKEYMQPVLDVLSPIHNFTIDTQVQLYATPGVQNEVLSKEDLSSFINAAEWPLSPSIGGAPTINFVVFVGNQTIASSEDSSSSHSWLIPQWGTVYLLPLPTPPTSPPQPLNPPPNLYLPPPLPHRHPLRLSSAPPLHPLPHPLRRPSAPRLLHPRLPRPPGSRPPVHLHPRSVADGVASSMAHLRFACDTLGTPEGLEHARIAEAEAERAFFEKSMVGQLYFPDEHKVAVYLPLLGPVAVPLLMGLVKEVKGQNPDP
ncbi:GPI transamidase component [Collariella sp. IMI 366227]|nr:GPI transamidase component [Collariella sp. IMI 366227]